MAKRKVFQYMPPGSGEWKEVFWDDRKAVHYFLWCGNRYDLRVIEVDEPDVKPGDTWKEDYHTYEVVSERMTGIRQDGGEYHCRTVRVTNRKTGRTYHTVLREDHIDRSITNTRKSN